MHIHAHLIIAAALLLCSSTALAQSSPALRMSPEALARVKAKTSVQLATPAPGRRASPPKKHLSNLKKARVMTSSQKTQLLRELGKEAMSIKKPFNVTTAKLNVPGKYSLYVSNPEVITSNAASFSRHNDSMVTLALMNLKRDYLYMVECNMTTKKDKTFATVNQRARQTFKATHHGDMFSFVFMATSRTARINLSTSSEYWMFRNCRITPAAPLN